MTYMLLLNCALKLVEEIILYYDARSKKNEVNIFSLLLLVFGCHERRAILKQVRRIGGSRVQIRSYSLGHVS